VIQGVQKDLLTVASLPLAGTSYTPASLVALVQSRINAGNAVVTARANWLDAVKIYDGINEQANVAIHDLKQYVIGAFGTTSSKLADFGFAARKVAVLTPVEKAAATEKRLATRKARNTLGPKAKLKVTGASVAASSAAAPAAAGNGAPAGAPAAAPATAPTVTVNVTTSPASGQPGNSTATVGTTAGTPSPTPAPEPVAPAAAGTTPAKS
jgi:hypothetical protein